jgi:hypothetical protein
MNNEPEADDALGRPPLTQNRCYAPFFSLSTKDFSLKSRLHHQEYFRVTIF